MAGRGAAGTRGASVGAGVERGDDANARASEGAPASATPDAGPRARGSRPKISPAVDYGLKGTTREARRRGKRGPRRRARRTSVQERRVFSRARGRHRSEAAERDERATRVRERGGGGGRRCE